jgi:hypothetical protein
MLVYAIRNGLQPNPKHPFYTYDNAGDSDDDEEDG